MKRGIWSAAAAAFAMLATTAAIGQTPAAGGEPGAALLAINTLPAKSPAKLRVTSPAFRSGGDMPMQNTSYQDSVFPGLSWSWGPYGTRSYALIMQDDDAIYHGAAILHFSLYDIDGGVRRLAAGMTEPPAGASFGPNIAGPAKAYMGPHAPPGPRHHYHFQVFALDETIAPTPIKTYADLTAAMSGHVLASGEVVALAHAPDTPPPAPAAH
ncbi:MAG TPA: YbhB/YbcL family Raf kinase inhibitor-like protein [Caulobacteraceae bacterium]|nr:YbhB/YbcL family Raf kinase inhibitor-like protein [Caulobacteraceae bacterium]